MSKKINNIHDKFFKSIMSDINLARAFMQEFLPEEVLGSLDLETLEISNQSFIDEKLKEAFSDAVFKVKLKSMAASVYISILLEHKSYKEEFTPFQILLYQANGYLQQLKSGETLQIILPVVYYHGKETWELKRIADFFSEHPPVLKKYIPDFSMEYVDLVRMDDAALYRLQNTLLASALLLQRYSHQPKALHEKISRIFNTINSNTSGNFIQTLLVYTMHVLNVEDNFIIEVAKKLNPDMKEKVLSTYEKMELRCRNEGIEQGIEQKTKEVVMRGHKNGIAIKDLAIITSMSEERVTEIINQNASGLNPQ